MGAINTIGVGVMELLLTCTSTGKAVHLSSTACPGSAGRAAVPHYYLTPSRQRGITLDGYDRPKLAVARWAKTTLCGREWVGMVAGPGGPIYWGSDEPVFAPTCRRCLALMDGLFPPPQPATCLPLVVDMVVDLLAGGGYAEVLGVPGDQHNALRSSVRTALRYRTGHNSRTYVADCLVIFMCAAVYDRRRDEHMSGARGSANRPLAMGSSPTVPVEVPGWRLDWDSWDGA